MIYSLQSEPVDHHSIIHQASTGAGGANSQSQQAGVSTGGNRGPQTTDGNSK